MPSSLAEHSMPFDSTPRSLAALVAMPPTLAATIASGDGSIEPTSGNTGSGSRFTFTYTEGTAGTLVHIEITLAQGGSYAYGQALLQL